VSVTRQWCLGRYFTKLSQTGVDALNSRCLFLFRAWTSCLQCEKFHLHKIHTVRDQTPTVKASSVVVGCCRESVCCDRHVLLVHSSVFWRSSLHCIRSLHSLFFQLFSLYHNVCFTSRRFYDNVWGAGLQHLYLCMHCERWYQHFILGNTEQWHVLYCGIIGWHQHSTVCIKNSPNLLACMSFMCCMNFLSQCMFTCVSCLRLTAHSVSLCFVVSYTCQ